MFSTPNDEFIKTLLLFSCSIMANSFQPHGLQHTRLPCPSLVPGSCSNSCPLSRWCHATISSSVTPFTPALNLSHHQGLFQRVGSSHQMARVLELQLQHQSFWWIFRVDFLWDWLVWSPNCPGDAEVFSNTSVLWCSAFFMVQLSDLFMTTEKTIALTSGLLLAK